MRIAVLLLAAASCSTPSRDDGKVLAATPRSSDHQKELSIAGRLQVELGSRPSASPRVEDVVGALQRAGIAAGSFHQHWAAPLGASYCAGGQSKAQMPISICEYPDESAARSGQEQAQSTWARGLGGAAFVNRATTLLIMQPEKTAQTNAEVLRIADLFAGLGPR